MNMDIEELKSWIGKKVCPADGFQNEQCRNKIGIVVGYDAYYSYPLIVLWPGTLCLRSNLRHDSQTEINYDIVPGGHFNRRYMKLLYIVEAP